MWSELIAGLEKMAFWLVPELLILIGAAIYEIKCSKK